jgi:predicted branched-subunit amino acid permease
MPGLPFPALCTMRRFARSSDFRAGFREMLPAALALTPFGIVCGIGAASAGADWIAALAMSAIIFSGAAQVLSAQLLAADAPFAVIVLTCFVAGLRFLMYSAAMAPHVRTLSPAFQRALAFLMTDQSFALAIRRFSAEHDPRGGGLYFLGGGVALWSAWQAQNLIGYFAGHAVPTSWSLDFAVPLCFIALIGPALRGIPTIVAALVGGGAVMLLAGLPMRLNLIVAGVLGIVAGTVVDIARERWATR